MPRPFLLSLLLWGVALAGCERAPDPVEEDCPDQALCDLEERFADHFCVAQDVRPRVYAPDTGGPDTEADPWVLGDWWTHEMSVDGRSEGTTKLVYFEDQDLASDGTPLHYMVGTTEREEALEKAMFGVNPVIGRVHRTLYSPHESGVHADMFHFPLCEGSTWETTFFDTRFTMAARQETVEVPGGEDPMGFRITGTGGGASIEIVYSPRVKWFTGIAVQRPDAVDVSLALEATGQGHQGEVHFLRGQKDEVFDLAERPAETTLPRAPGGEGAYDTLGVFLDVARTSGDGRVEVHVRDPDGTSVACVGIAGPDLLGDTDCPAAPLMLEVPWVEGDWRLEVVRPLLGDVEIEGEARLVSIYDRSGRV